MQAGGRHNMLPPPLTLTFDLLTLKVVSESRVTWATSVIIILVFLGLSVLDLPRCTRDVRRQTDRRQIASSLNAPAQGVPPPRERGHNKQKSVSVMQRTTAITMNTQFLADINLQQRHLANEIESSSSKFLTQACDIDINFRSKVNPSSGTSSSRS